MFVRRFAAEDSWDVESGCTGDQFSDKSGYSGNICGSFLLSIIPVTIILF